MKNVVVGVLCFGAATTFLSPLLPPACGPHRCRGSARSAQPSRDEVLQAAPPYIVDVDALPSPVPLREDEATFAAWLRGVLEKAPGALAYAAIYEEAQACIISWRHRYYGNPKLWKRLMKDRLVKELIEYAPVIAAVRDYVETTQLRRGERFTIVDLASGKGFLSMFLSEMLPPDRVERCFLVDKAWPLNTNGVRTNATVARPLKEHQISAEHLYGVHYDNASGRHVQYAAEWPVPLITSKQDLKWRGALRGMKRVIFERSSGPVILLAVHLCGTLSHRAIDLFNANMDTCSLLVLKPCCLPKMVHANRDEIFRLGAHEFAASDVCAQGSFFGDTWRGPKRFTLAPKFERWTQHLLRGIEPRDGGAKALEESLVQTKGGYQNVYIFGEHGPRTTPALWQGLEARRG